MSGGGSKTTKPVPAPRRGRKPKEPSPSDKLQSARLLFQNTVRQFYEWMDKLGKCVCCAYQKRRNVPKVGRPTEKQGTKVRNCTAMLSQIRAKLNTPTDNEQLLRLKRMSKSPHSNPPLGDLAL